MNRYLVKLAEKVKREPLQPQQKRALKKLEKEDAVILDHSTGSGKTRTFLTAVERAQQRDPNKRSLILAPASLVTNIDKEIEKHHLKIDRTKLDAYSYEKAVNLADKLRKVKYNIAVADEAHKLRSIDTQRHTALSEIVSKADQRVLATATTSYNHISDIAPLANIAAGEKILPEGKKPFEDRFVSKKLEKPPLLKRIFGGSPKERSELKNSKELKDKLSKYVDLYDSKEDPASKHNFPTQTERTVEVEMSPEQQTLYKYMEQKLPWSLKMKVRMNLPLDKRDAAQLNGFSSGIRQVSNTTKPYMPNMDIVSPKMQKALENLTKKYKNDKNFRGVVYSNYRDAGIDEYSTQLTKLGIPHATYHGGMTRDQKDKVKNAYNNGEVPVMLVTSSGSEGLDLKGTKLMQILEPHFNKSKIDQVVGRGARFKSHSHLPKEERTVEVEHYISKFPASKLPWHPKNYTIDQYLQHNSQHKDDLNKQLKELLK